MSQKKQTRGPLHNAVVDTLLVVAALVVVLGQPFARPHGAEKTADPHSRRGPLMKLRLNDATEDELGLLPQIGPKMADRIVRFRSSNPTIRSWADFEQISGMGPSTIQTIQPWCTIEPPAEDLAGNH